MDEPGEKATDAAQSVPFGRSASNALQAFR